MYDAFDGIIYSIVLRVLSTIMVGDFYHSKSVCVLEITSFAT